MSVGLSGAGGEGRGDGGGEEKRTYHDEGAVEVEALPAALGHHVPAAPLAVLQHGAHKQQHAEAGVQAQEQQLPTVVVPVGPRQVAGGLALLLVQVRGLQPIGSTGRRGRGVVVTGSQRYIKINIYTKKKKQCLKRFSDWTGRNKRHHRPVSWSKLKLL